MTEMEKLQQQNQRTFLLIILNFIMFLILFFGLGYVAWQSSTLISRMEGNLEKVEQAVVQFRDRLQHMDVDTLTGKVVESTKQNMGDSIRTALNESDFSGSLSDLSQKVENAQASLEHISKTVQEANEKLQKIDTEQLAQLVSYNMLKGLGDGLSNAAEARKPTLHVDDKDESRATQ